MAAPVLDYHVPAEHHHRLELIQAAFARDLADDSPEALRAWLRRELPRATRTMRHRGNHRYAWTVDPELRGVVRSTAPYPKLFPLGGAA